MMARVAIFIALMAVAGLQLAYCNTMPPPGDNKSPPPGDNKSPPPSGNPPPGDNTTPPPGDNNSSPPGDNNSPPPGGKTDQPPGDNNSPKTSGRTDSPQADKKTSQPSGKTVSPLDDQTPFKGEGTFELSKEETIKRNKAFDPEATLNFDPRRMFGADGGISDSFKQFLGEDGLKGLNQTETKYKNILDVNGAFGGGKGNSEDVKAFFMHMSKLDMNTFDKLIDSPNTVTADDDIDFTLMAAINKTVLQDKLSKAPASVTDKICQDLQNEYTNGQNTKQIVKAIDCVASLAKSSKKPTGDLARAIADNKREDKSVSNWNGQDWLDAITGGYLDKLPPEHLRLIPKAVIDARMSDLTELFTDKKQRKIITDKLAQARGDSKLSASDISGMGDMLQTVSAKDLGNMDKTEMMNSMSALKNVKNDFNRVQLSEVRNKLRDDTLKFTRENMTDAIPFMDKSTIAQLPDKEVIGALTDLGAEEHDDKTARWLFEKLKSSEDYNDASKWTTAKLKDVGTLVKGFPAKTLKDATNVDFGSMLSSGDLRSMKLDDKRSARVVIERAMQDAGKDKLDQSDLENLGENVKGLKQDQVSSMDSTDVLNALESMKETFKTIAKDIDKSTTAEMIKKVGSAPGGLASNAEKLGPLLQDVSVAALMTESDSDFGDLSGQTPREFNCSEETSCAYLYQKVKASIGEPGLNNTMNYTKRTFMNLNKIMCGMSLDDLKKIPPTNELPDIIEVYREHCGELSKKKKDVLTTQLQYRLETATTVSEDVIDKIDHLLPGLTIAELENIGNCEYVCEKMGEISTTDISEDKLDKLANSYCLKCLGKTSGVLTTDDMDSLGTLGTGLGKGRVSDIESDAVLDVIPNIETSALNKAKGKQWTDKVKDVVGLSSEGCDLLETLGPLSMELSDGDKNTLSDACWESAGLEVIEYIDEEESNIKKREANGINDMSNSDKKAREENKAKVMGMIKDAFMVSGGNAKRRKRSVSSLSCSDMQSLGSGVVSMTTNELEAMADADFLECAGFLGSTSTWSTGQIASLLTVSIRSGTFGSSISWSADNVYEAGIIIQALSSSEITALTDLDLDAMSSMGQHEGWGETQLSSGFSRWLDLTKGDDASTVTSTELIGLGHFACGASTSHIISMSNTEYSFAASYIGELTSCSDSQLVAYADLAEAAFGSISSWDTSIVSTIGSVVGGLTASELGSLSTSQVAAITPASIAQIPSSVFVGFTVEQLSSFSVAQAQATTPSQQDGLSTDQLNALASAGATIESSVATIQASIAVVLFSTILAMLMKAE